MVLGLSAYGITTKARLIISSKNKIRFIFLNAFAKIIKVITLEYWDNFNQIRRKKTIIENIETKLFCSDLSCLVYVVFRFSYLKVYISVRLAVN